jgi:RNA polymerase sigma-70 factor (ECF subfamily)
MLRAFRFIERFRERTDARAWLLAILRNVRIDRLRQNKAQARDVSLDQLATEPADNDQAIDEPPGWEQPQEILEAFSDQQMIDALQQLPEEIRWTLLLVDVEQLDHREAAEILDVPVGTIKSRAHRGRAMLRQALAPMVDSAATEETS